MRTLLLCSSILVIRFASAQDNIPSEVVGDTGTVSFTYQGTPVVYTVVRAADGHAWLQQNLGAVQVADSSIGIGEPTYGDLYQWGRWTDGHQVRTSVTAQASTLLQNNPAGLGGGSPFFYIGANPADWWAAGLFSDTWQGTVASSTNGIDPCSGIGDGWTLPTQSDWANVLTQEGITNTVTALSSNLRLPAAGSREAQNGMLINVGSFGNYWSSTTSDIYAKDVTIGSALVNPTDDAYRSYGMSVRCLNKSLHAGVAEERIGAGIQVFPNPTNGSFTVMANDGLIQRIELYTMDGRLLRTYVEGTSTLAMSFDAPMANGLYRLNITTTKGTERHTLLLER